MEVIEEPRDAALFNGHDDGLVRVLSACAVCGQRIELVLGPRICESCALYARKVEEARRLTGSPSETAIRQEISLPENWHD